MALGASFRQDTSSQAEARVHADKIFKLIALSPNGGSASMYQRIGELAVSGSLSERQELVAFEENQLFIYAVSDTSSSQSPPRSPSRLIRRLIFLKPSILVLDDEFPNPGSKKRARWLLYSQSKPAIVGSVARLREEQEELLCETLLPKNATRESVELAKPGGEREEHSLNVAGQPNPAGIRFLHVLQARKQGDESTTAVSEVVTQDGQLVLTIRSAQKVFRLALPKATTGAGEISILDEGGKALLGPRLLAAGILPHGVEGMKLLEQWDAGYRKGHPPLWDAGLPSGELKKLVEQGTIRACRVVELGCGSGTDAVYLASKGFEVTAIDIAPTALNQAQEKARKAGVQVRWLFADVLAAPKLDPFDFIYDRGCYHEVRDQNLAAYQQTVRRYSRPGTRFLLLAGSINETSLDYGPPRLAAEEIRDDFSALFDFEWIRESRFEIAQPNAIGPLAWSVLMRRKGTQ